MHVPSAVVTKLEPPNCTYYRTVVSSNSKGNPFPIDETFSMDIGTFCETVIKTREPLLVANALEDDQWTSAPEIQVGMVSYLGFPVAWPDGRMFGTICVLDDRTNPYSDLYQKLLLHCRDVLEGDLQTLARLGNELEEERAHLSELDQRVEQRTRELAAANDELRRSKAFLAEGQRLSLTGTSSWRLATNEVTWSEQLYRIYEFEIGMPVSLELIRTRIHPEDRSLIEQMMDQVRGGGGNDFEWQYRLLMPDHSIKYLHAFAHAIRDQDGQLEYIAAVQDVTAHRMSEEALAKARSELAHVSRISTLGAMTASIAHEVNQPLSGIITNASTCLRMLAADPPDIDGARETAKRTTRDGERASEVITRLRGLFAHKQIVTEQVDLSEAAREVIALSNSELRRAGVVVRDELAESLPSVPGDRVQLQQVIINLIMNASDAMSGVDGRPRELTVKSEREDGGGVRVSVQDSGVGFPPEAVDRLFEAFYSTKNGGMGIGLSVSRSIIERHHGRLWGAANEGHGATFAFSLPIDTKV
jgi:C4-dicarboxylate-specific signal transduction histidine kinase